MAKKRKGRPRPLPSPDENLAFENFKDLNEAFYRASPHTYLRQRHFNLVLTRSKGAEMDAMAKDGLEVGALKLTSTPDDEDASGEREKFAIAESEVLLNHVSETLLRLYLSHRGIGPCPWLDIARTRSPQKFKKMTEGLCRSLEANNEDSSIQEVFFGSRDVEIFGPAEDPDSWMKGTKSLAGYLDFYAKTFLDANAYNAAKHGLALVAGRSSLSLADGDTKEMLLSDGPALECLVVTNEKDGKRRWARESKWLNLDRCSTYSWMGCEMIDALWKVGRWRYLKERPDSIKSFAQGSLQEVEEFFTGLGGKVQAERFTMPLMYYHDEPQTGS